MEEEKYNINWLGLFIKVTIFVVVALIAIWLITKIVSKDKGLSIEENNKLFQEAPVEYFKKNLPEKDKNKVVTLSQLITWDYLKELKNEEGKICDIKKSKSKIEQIDNYYSIKTELVCGKESETNYIKLGNEECTNCDIKIDGLKIEEEKPAPKPNDKEDSSYSKGETPEIPYSKGNSNVDNSNSSNNNQPVNNYQILYEYIKPVNEYSKWYTGKVTGNNIENSTKIVSYSKFCKKSNLNNCITDKTENRTKYTNYKIVDTWKENIDIYRYKITIQEYIWSNQTYLEGYTKTGNTKTVY